MSLAPESVSAWRATTGLTQVACAELVGVKRRCWQRWEKGLRTPPDMLSRLLAEISLRMALQQRVESQKQRLAELEP